jgi:uncharacterized membrane protein
MWGIIPLISLPFISRGARDSTLDIWAVVVNSLTIFPACVLAFWHRRPACVWLTINAGLVVTSMTFYVLRTHQYRVGSIIGTVVSLLLAVLLDMAEVRRWPGALDRDYENLSPSSEPHQP